MSRKFSVGAGAQRREAWKRRIDGPLPAAVLEAGFETFSKLKPLFHQAGLNDAGLLNPPYGKRFESMLKMLLR